MGSFIDLNGLAIRWLLKETTTIIKKEPMLLELEAPIMVTGDFHGQYYDMLRLMDICGGHPPENKFLLIGDFVDRGK